MYFFSHKFSFNFFWKKSTPGVLDLFVASFGNAMPFAFSRGIDLMYDVTFVYVMSLRKI